MSNPKGSGEGSPEELLAGANITIVEESDGKQIQIGKLEEMNSILVDTQPVEDDSQRKEDDQEEGDNQQSEDMDSSEYNADNDADLNNAAVWNESGCIICNVDMKISSPDNKSAEKRKLKLFFLETFAVGDQIHLEEETVFPFCVKCAEEIEQLMTINNKIDLMHKQYNKLRDSLARKSANTFLCRTNPKLLEEDLKIEKISEDSGLLVKETYQDRLYNRWKSRYELIQPGPKIPMMIRSMDSRGRVTVVRVDSKNAGGNRSNGIQRTGAGGSGYPFECEVCDKGFAIPQQLVSHMRLHNAEKPFKCDVCGKGFAQRGGLVTHTLVHTGAKPYTCDICGKSFRQKYHLTQHSLIHSGEKPFSCSLCGKAFNVKMNLREHMRRHTGDRPYKCPYCTVIGFFRKKMLRDHIVKMHPNRLLPMELVNEDQNHANNDSSSEDQFMEHVASVSASEAGGGEIIVQHQDSIIPE